MSYGDNMSPSEAREYGLRKKHYLKRANSPKTGNRKHRKGDKVKDKMDSGYNRVFGTPSCSVCGKEVLFVTRDKPCGGCNTEDAQ
tara:strand:- start:61468 stop:61722 length:255 start_codon:yes stop_codon:yes gene_type:complete